MLNKINYFEEVVEDDIVFNIKYVGNIGEVRIMISDDMVKMSGSGGGAMGQYLIGSDMEGWDWDENENGPAPIPTIFIEEWVWNDVHTREFFIYHEYGHHYYKHNDLIEAMGGVGSYLQERANESDSILKMELQADSYAVEQLGEKCVVNGLEIALAHVKEIYPDYSNSEIQSRINHWKKEADK